MISIITTTYNRAYILPKLYQSLLNQTCFQFEWIVIDDGSNDETDKLVKNWINNCSLFSILYCKTNNRGKHYALNDAVKMANYNWCIVVDSDDYLVNDAIVCIHSWLLSVKDDNSFAGIAGLRGYISTNKKVGKYPTNKKYKEYIDATNLERKKYKLTGDKAEIYKTYILRKYPFPEFNDEKFLDESVIWDQIASDGYKIRWFNKIIYRGEYIDDGLTKSNVRLFMHNYEGFTAYTHLRMTLHGWITRQSAIEFYFRISKKMGINYYNTLLNLEITNIQTIIPLIIVNPMKKILNLYRLVKTSLILNFRRRLIENNPRKSQQRPIN